MILETGRIVAIEPKGLWVETIQRSSCGSCQAQKGCGHSLLAKFGASASHLWVLLDGRTSSSYCLGDEVTIGVPEDVIVRGAMMIYMVPLISMLIATVAAHQYHVSDGITAVAALMGLAFGACVVRIHAYCTRFDKRLQPVLVDDAPSLQLINVAAVQ